MKIKIKIAFLAKLLLFLSFSTFASEKPNVILILSDDASPQYYSHSPNLNYMASKGVRFTKAYAASICAASRHLLMTGKFGRETGCYHNSFNLFLKNDVNRHLTIGEMFKASGYKTAYFGKWGVAGDPIHYDYTMLWNPDYLQEGLESPSTGARYWNPAIIKNGQALNTTPRDYGPSLFVDDILKFMDDNKDSPYTIHYGMVDPHAERGHDWPKTPDLKFPSDKKQRYKNIIRYGDILLGKIIKKAEQSTRPFIIIFASDNATANEGKQEATVNGCHVAFVVYGTDIHKRGASNSLISFADVLPTLASFAEYGKKIYCDGLDLSSYLKGESHFTRKRIYSNIGTSNVYISKRHSIEDRDFVRGNADGVFRFKNKITSKNSEYKKLIRYGSYVNGSPLKRSDRIFNSPGGRAFLKFWIALGKKD